MKNNPEYQITITRRGGRAAAATARRLREAVAATLHRHQTLTAAIHVHLVDDETIGQLNAQYLNHAGPTDVLTFDLRETAGGSTPARRTCVEGDIIASLDTAAREARRRMHEVSAELALYAVHGTLHLLGYDDRTARQAARMHRLEDAILHELGVGTVYDVRPPRGPAKKRNPRSGAQAR